MRVCMCVCMWEHVCECKCLFLQENTICAKTFTYATLHAFLCRSVSMCGYVFQCVCVCVCVRVCVCVSLKLRHGEDP